MRLHRTHHYDGDKEHAKDRKEHPRCMQGARKEHASCKRQSLPEPASTRVTGESTDAGRKTLIHGLLSSAAVG